MAERVNPDLAYQLIGDASRRLAQRFAGFLEQEHKARIYAQVLDMYYRVMPVDAFVALLQQVKQPRYYSLFRGS